MVNSPIKWVGGKSKLRNKIIEMLPPTGTYTCYVEVFAGAAWVLFGKDASPVEILNDIDGELINFYRVLKDRPDELATSLLDFNIVSRAEFRRLLAQDPSRLNKLQRAHRFFYILVASWGGEWKNPRFQTSISDHGKGNRLFSALRALRQRLHPASERLAGVIIEQLDWRSCIKRYDDPKTVMYLDPPYPENKCNFAFNMLTYEEHEELAKRLAKARCRWLLSSYDNERVRQLFHDYYIHPVAFPSGMDGQNGRRNKELLITNYDIEAVKREYNKIVRLSGMRHIAVGASVLVASGAAPIEGVIERFECGQVVVRLGTKKRKHLKPDELLRASGSSTVDDRELNKFLALRKEISAGLDRRSLMEFDRLRRDGHITDVVAEINAILRQAIEEQQRDRG